MYNRHIHDLLTILTTVTIYTKKELFSMNREANLTTI